MERYWGFCPRCGICIGLIELNCRIIRCGALVRADGRMEQFPPHASEDVVMELLSMDHVGCGAPLEFDLATQEFIVTTYDS